MNLTSRVLLFACVLPVYFSSAMEFESALMDDSTPLVISFTHPDCGAKCDEWLQWIDRVAEVHGDVNYVETDVDMMHEFEDMRIVEATQSIFNVPNGVFIFGDLVVPFNREYTDLGVRRWIEDGLFGMDGPVFLNDLDTIESYRARFNGSVEVVSRDPKYWYSMKVLTSIGFAFRGFDVDTLYFVRSIFGTDVIVFSPQDIFHGLIDTILPYEKSHQYDVQEVVSYYASREMHVVHEGELPSWWYEFASLYPSTLFVHYQPDETELPAPSVTIYNRTVVYQRNSTDIETVRWFHDVLHGRATPSERSSQMPSQLHPTVQEITGDTLSTHLRDEFVFVSLYDDDGDPCAPLIGDWSERYMNETATYARFHMGLNDHEALDEQARPGFIVLYVNGTRRRVTRCIK